MKEINNPESSNLNSITVHFHKVKKIVTADWIKQIIYTILETEQSYHQGAISIVLVSDEYITQLNKQFLDKNKPTDVLAFPWNEDYLWGEVYISVDRAQEQSKYYQVNFTQELARLIIHGMLHLMGYDDQQRDTKISMENREEFYLEKMNMK